MTDDFSTPKFIPTSAYLMFCVLIRAVSEAFVTQVDLRLAVPFFELKATLHDD